MKLDVFDINEFVKLNDVKEVTSPTSTLNGLPSDDGCLSYEIFGADQDSRKNTFGYIDLSGTGDDKYVHPVVYEYISSRMKRVDSLIRGIEYAVLGANNELLYVDEDTPGAGTGLDFFYEIFDKVNWTTVRPDGDDVSVDIKTRDTLFNKLGKNEFFVDKWLVIPPYYREESSLDLSMGDELNKLYKELISMSRSMKVDFGFRLNNARLAIQNQILVIYKTTMSPLTGKHLRPDGKWAGSAKNAMFRKNLLGKTVDYAAINIISAPNNSLAFSAKELPAPFGYGLFPITNIISLFHPFFVAYLSNMLTSFAESLENRLQYNRFNKYQYSNNDIEKLLRGYLKTEHDRTKPILFKYTDLNDELQYIRPLIYIFDESVSDDDITMGNYLKIPENKIIARRPLNITDVVYISARYIIKDKHVVVTRYPISNFQNISPLNIKMMSTKKEHKNVKIYMPMFDYRIDLDKYPMVIDEYDEGRDNPDLKFFKTKMKTDTQFFNHFVPDILTISALGADFDGDALYLKGLFTTEANREADKIVFSKKNLFSTKGSLSRSVVALKKDVVLTAYSLTK